ncbi:MULTISPECIES: LacI family DNA-binding transcriptional regulator [unclassified Microbacterium]|uniref:LacI family DNA-binding transcriptional regulator n=1 Tax=unclassified Microbacterium TaxID=2609290 RepID=UPI00301923A7
MEHATIRDVARVAGVSVKTVSRVLNKEQYVAAATRARVAAVMRDLAYRPNPAAQGLRRSIAGSIAFVCEDISEPFAAQLARSIEHEAAERYVVIVSSMLGDPGLEQRTIETLASGYADGIILAPTPGAKTYLARLPRGVPVVCLDRPARDFASDTVLTDNVGGMASAVSHLLSQGHTRIAYIGDGTDVFTQRERLAGYRLALEDAGLPADDELIYQHTPDASRLRKHLAWLSQIRQPPTAFVSANSLTTLALAHAGFDVGSDRFIAFDDFPLADVFQGGINVVAQDADALGAEATRALLRRIETDEGPVRTIRLGTRLILRKPGSADPGDETGRADPADRTRSVGPAEESEQS